MEMDDLFTPFYLIWNPNAASPTFRHYTKESAIQEARRLATKTPGATFYILEAQLAAKKPDPVKIYELDGVPF